MALAFKYDSMILTKANDNNCHVVVLSFSAWPIEGRGGFAQAESSTDAKVRNLSGSIVRERVIINLNCGHGLPELGVT